MKNKIGILGSGMVAQTLAGGFLKNGKSVMLGTRDASKLNDWKAQAGENASVGSFTDAALFGELIILAVKGYSAVDTLEQAGIEHFSNKTVIDVSNPIANLPPVNGVIQYFTGPNESLMERLQAKAPDAHFVKAFNSVGAGKMVNPVYEEGKPTMFICGNSGEAKQEVIEILNMFGWDGEDMGFVEAARAIEPLCVLWCIPGFLNNSWTHAFKVLKK